MQHGLGIVGLVAFVVWVNTREPAPSDVFTHFCEQTQQGGNLEVSMLFTALYYDIPVEEALTIVQEYIVNHGVALEACDP